MARNVPLGPPKREQKSDQKPRVVVSSVTYETVQLIFPPFFYPRLQGGPVEILPFLYLGSAYHASQCELLANLHITALLNVSRRTSESCTTHLHYKWIPVEDSHTADISSHFPEAIDFIGRSGQGAPATPSCPFQPLVLMRSPLPGGKSALSVPPQRIESQEGMCHCRGRRGRIE